MARPASKAFLRALAESRAPRCEASHTTDRCTRPKGHTGRHRAELEGGMTMQWTDKKAEPHKRPAGAETDSGKGNG